LKQNNSEEEIALLLNSVAVKVLLEKLNVWRMCDQHSLVHALRGTGCYR